MKKQLIMALCCLPFLCGFFMASLSADPSAASSQKASSEIEKVIAAKLEREQMDQEDFSGSEIQQKEEEVIGVNKALFGFGEPESYTTSHKGAWHFATSVSGTGNHTYLEDGSGWMLYPSNPKKEVLNWEPEDIIMVTPAPWYSFHDYVLVNYNSGAKVYADLKEKPTKYNAYTLYITEINLSEQRLTLSDRTVWEFRGRADYNTLASKWRVNQKVFIGINTSWPSKNTLPNLLISVEPGIDGYIRAECKY